MTRTVWLSSGASQTIDYHRDSLTRISAMLAMLAISFLILCELIVVFVGEHFNTAADRYGRRHRGFIHLLTAILLGAFIAAVIYVNWIGTRDLNRTVQAYVALLFVFLGLLLLHQILRTPHLAYYRTSMMLLVVVCTYLHTKSGRPLTLAFQTLTVCICPIYLQIKRSTDSLQSSLAFYLMW